MTLFAILGLLLLAAVGLGIATLVFSIGTNSKVDKLLPSTPYLQSSCAALEERRVDAYLYRSQEAHKNYARGYQCPQDNGDEALYLSTDRRASFSKGLVHDSLGHVTAPSFNSLLHALKTRNPADFQSIQLGGVRKLVNPQSGFAFELEGLDSHALVEPLPPKFASAWAAAEMVEDYWMARLRDVKFEDYGVDPLAAAAMADLNALSDYRGPKPVGAANLFRGGEDGTLIGPYLSQFFYLPCTFGASNIEQQFDPYAPNVDFMTTWTEYLSVQNGNTPTGTLSRLGTKRYMITGRDLSNFVHMDVLYQAYFQAGLILMGLGAPMKPNLPYQTPSSKEEGFVTFGAPHLFSLLGEVCSRVMKAQWYNKWSVHRRLRPEVFAARVDRHKNGIYSYDLHPEVLNSAAVTEIFNTYGSYLLPQAFPEGSPAHPAYGSGHATVAGACITILKAWYKEDWAIPSPVKPSANGLTLIPYVGPALTVGGELNKIGTNVAFGRNVAGGKTFFSLFV